MEERQGRAVRGQQSRTVIVDGERLHQRLIVPAETEAWARTAGQVSTGYAASVIGCDAEAGIERFLAPDETPDGRPYFVLELVDGAPPSQSEAPAAKQLREAGRLYGAKATPGRTA